MDRTKAFDKPKPKKPAPSSPFLSKEDPAPNAPQTQMGAQAPAPEPPMGGKGMAGAAFPMAASGAKASMDKAGFMREDDKCDMCLHFSNNQCDKVEVDFAQNDPTLTVCEKFFEPREEAAEGMERESVPESAEYAAAPSAPRSA